MQYDGKRDKQNYRSCVDLLDLHNGIGALCEMDLIETPLSVMNQGHRAAQEISHLRRTIDNLEAFISEGPALEILANLRERQATQEKERRERMAEYDSTAAKS